MEPSFCTSTSNDMQANSRNYNLSGNPEMRQLEIRRVLTEVGDFINLCGQLSVQLSICSG
jgi:hypothetical protein